MGARGFLLGVLVLSILLTLGSGFYATAYLASVLAVALVLAFLWSRANVRWLRVQVSRAIPQVQVGGTLVERVTVANLSKLPVPWVAVEDRGTLPGHAAGRVLSLGPEARRSWEAVTLCRQRGLFTLGPLELSSSDPLGLFTARRVLGQQEKVLIYPPTLPLPGFTLSTPERPGESLEYHPTSALSPNVAGIRLYEKGDSLNRIHWKSTARHGKLMVKEFELERQGGAWVLLDMAKAAQWGEAPENTEEYGVTAAASIVAALLAEERSVGLALAGDEEHILPPEKGASHRLRVLEILARVRATGETPLSELVKRLERNLGPASALVVIGSSRPELLALASFMLERGLSGAVVVLDAASFGGQDEGLPLTRSLLTAGLAAYLVRRGDNLSRALSLAPSAGAISRR